MYIRIFSSYRPFRITCYGVLAFVVVPSAVITLLTILSCRPIPYFWDRDMHGRCLNTLALAYANSAFAMTQDVLLIVLPIFMLARLQMSLKKKLLIGESSNPPRPPPRPRAGAAVRPHVLGLRVQKAHYFGQL